MAGFRIHECPGAIDGVGEVAGVRVAGFMAVVIVAVCAMGIEVGRASARRCIVVMRGLVVSQDRPGPDCRADRFGLRGRAAGHRV